MASAEKGVVELVERAENPDGPEPSNGAEGVWLAAKSDPKVLAYSILMSLGPMTYGFDIVIVGVVTAIPAFLETFARIHGRIGNQWSVADRFGRRVAMIVGGVVVYIGIGVIYASDQTGDILHRRIAFMFGKIVIGMGLSMLMSTSQAYNSEIAPTRLRAPLLSLLQFSLTFGMLIAAVVAGHETTMGSLKISYRICFATQWALAGASILGALIVPESPAYHLRRGDIDGARKSMGRLYSTGTVDSRITALQAILDQEREFEATTRAASYIECFKGSNWRRTRIVLYVNIMQQFLGVSFVSNGTYFLIIAGMTPSNSIMVLEIVSGLSMAANIISWFLASTAGQRKSLLIGCIGVGIIWTSVGISACFKGKAALWYTGVAMNVVMVFYNLAAGGIGPVVAGETSSIRLRAKTSSLGFIVNGLMSWAFTFFVPYMFNVDKANWGGKTAFFFTGLSFVIALIIFFEVPEMNKRTYVELDRMFEMQLPTRRFKHHGH